MATLHFTDKELRCRCCGFQLMDSEFLELLEELRRIYNRSIILLSAYRCPEHNNEVSTTGFNGVHTLGKAVDIKVYGKNAYELVEIAMMLQFKGFGFNQSGIKSKRFIHLDNLCSKDRPYIWSY